MSWKQKRNRRNRKVILKPIGVQCTKLLFQIRSIDPLDEACINQIVTIRLEDLRLATKAACLQQIAVKFLHFAAPIRAATCAKWRTPPREYMVTIPIEHALIASRSATLAPRKLPMVLDSRAHSIPNFRLWCDLHDPSAGDDPLRHRGNSKLYEIVLFLLWSPTLFLLV